MSIKKTKEHLTSILDDIDNRVIALSGKWGTGKSYSWKEIQKASKNEAVKNAYYVSLFGCSEITQLKLKLVQSACGAGATSEDFERLKSLGKGTVKLLRALHPAFSAIDEIAALAIPTLISNKFIVIDDIERKHEKLNIDEVLGFIDEYTQNHGARILLILNSDQLQDKSKTLWETLREKVIDQEIKLETSPEEAFDIALTLTATNYADHIRSAVEICKITNIRIIRKVIKAVNRILDGRGDLRDTVLKRLIPSTVLLAAIHYKGLENGPDFDYVLNAHDYDRSNEDTNHQFHSQWNILLAELGINGCDEYENLVIEFLKSGLFEVDSIASIVRRYVNEEEWTETNRRIYELHYQSTWHLEISDADLLKEAKALISNVHLLDCYSVTSLHHTVMQIDGGEEIAKEIISTWKAEFRKKNHQDFNIDHVFQRPHQQIHPEIYSEFESLGVKLTTEASIVDVCRSIRLKSGWGNREEVIMRKATSEQYEMYLTTLVGENLKMFMLHNIDLYQNRAAYEKHFGQAMEKFTEACRNIYTKGTDKKRAKLIKLVFDDANLSDVLTS